MDNILYLTELLGLPVLDLKGRRIGVVKDAAIVPLIDPARIDRFLVGAGYTWLSIRHDQVRDISLAGIHLRDEQVTPYHADEYMLRMVRDLLDQQIIDAHGRKVVRVNDVTFEIQQQDDHEILRLIEVDIGIRSIIRRLLQGVAPKKWIRKLQEPIPPNSIRWEFCSILEPDPQRRLRLNVTHTLLEKMHPADLADIVEKLSPEDREAIFETLNKAVAADTLSEIQPQIQARILESLDAERAADIVEEMPPDEAADLLAELEEETSHEILEEMDVEPKAELSELLEFAEDSAGGMMNTECVVLHENSTVADAIAALRGNEELLDNLNTLFLIDAGERLVAAVPIARLFVASETAPLKDLASETLLKVSVDEHRDRVTELFDKYNILTLPVVDDQDRLVGVITADDIISVLRNK
jgi:magnesium transporter